MTRRVCLKLTPHQVQHVLVMAEVCVSTEPSAAWIAIEREARKAIAFAEKRDAAEGAVVT